VLTICSSEFVENFIGYSLSSSHLGPFNPTAHQECLVQITKQNPYYGHSSDCHEEDKEKPGHVGALPEQT
jgi:hypothetical protein